MNAFTVLTRLRVLDVLRSRSSSGFVIIFPIALLIGLALVFMNGHPFERRTVVLVESGAPPSRSASAIREQLAPFDEVRIESVAQERVAFGKLRARMASAVLFPASGSAPARLVVGPRDQLLGSGLASKLTEAPTISVLDVPKWGYVHYLFPGVLAFTVLLSGLFGMGYTMVLSRQNGFLKKLATTPMRKFTFVGAQITGRMLLVLVQVLLLVATAWLGFDVHFSFGSLLWVIVVCILGLLTFLGLGFALACLVKTEDLVVDVISSVNIPLVFLSEIFFPLDALPAPLAAIGAALPSTEMVRLLRSVLLYGNADWQTLAPGLAVMLAWMLAAFALSLRVFKWHA